MWNTEEAMRSNESFYLHDIMLGLKIHNQIFKKQEDLWVEQYLYYAFDFTYLENKLKSALPLTIFYNEQKHIGCQGSQHHCSAGSTGWNPAFLEQPTAVQ